MDQTDHALDGKSLLPMEYQREGWSMLKDSIYEAQEALRIGIENTQELLAEHDLRLGRTTRSNIHTAARIEQEIEQMKTALAGLQKPNGPPYGNGKE